MDCLLGYRSIDGTFGFCSTNETEWVDDEAGDEGGDVGPRAMGKLPMAIFGFVSAWLRTAEGITPPSDTHSGALRTQMGCCPGQAIRSNGSCPEPPAFHG